MNAYSAQSRAPAAGPHAMSPPVSVGADTASVLLVDDSAFVRMMYQERWLRHGWRVLAAHDGPQALARWRDFDPDLITLDVTMPGMNGVEVAAALRQAGYGGVLVMLSAATTAGAQITFAALAAGANDFVSKPQCYDDIDAAVDLVLQKYAAIRSSRHPITSSSRSAPAAIRRPLRGLCLAASTGGPQTLADLLEGLPPPAFPVMIVQHMPAGFTAPFAARLARLTGWRIQEAPPDGTRVPWRSVDAVIAAGGRHLRVSATEAWSVTGERLHGVIPSVDVTVRDAVKVWGARFCIVVLTGMGDDGALEIRDAHTAQALVVAESPETAVVYGMPRAVVEGGAADVVWPLPDIRRWLAQSLPGPQHTGHLSTQSSNR
ncbi:MAG: chemotaxis protein CheB [Clostridia bacterium]